ncbi:hypothetical protein Hden_0390 [Hyphomicrobium denitrificans ATCC 51888]|uniref:Uncharacterized protein n=2 Tax=Hyphomicrobium denitrificans TaxID=53399 RepID=D8JRI3_HYPDA|nr:hypothetical protein Hden_0390 [Hyphomicrobium denitrificans ATCC 51888]
MRHTYALIDAAHFERRRFECGRIIMRAIVVISTVLTMLAASPLSSRPAAAEPIDPAQAIAQKFIDADRAAPAPPRAKPKPARITKSEPTAPGLDYETEMLENARAEQAERRKVIAEPAPLVIAQPAPSAAPEPIVNPPPAPPQTTEPAAKPVAPAQPAMIQRRQTADTKAATVPDAVPARPDTRATVLIVLDPDDTEQAHVKSDPIICFDQQCWISNGLDSPAKPMPRSEAVALKTTETPTGDSCSGKSACAFRNVAFQPETQIQVVEVGESRGVSDGAYTVAADSTCRKLNGDLTCDNALVTHAFRMWVVPEMTAQQVGASALEDAVAEGLQDSNNDNSADGK